MDALSTQQAANKRFTFSSQAFPDLKSENAKFDVVNMEGFESISRPFRFDLTLVSADADIDFDDMLQQTASFTIFAADGLSSAPYYGVLAEFEQLHQAGGHVFYRAVLVPRLWRLSLCQVSEVYLDEKDIPALIKKVLESADLSSLDVQFKISGSYRERSFVCQYQESHLDFLSRWMEKEGLYYWFEHGVRERMVIVDNVSMHAAATLSLNYRQADQLDTGTASDSVQSFTCSQKPLPRQVILQDYNPLAAVVLLRAAAPVSDNGIGDVMQYGDHFLTQEEGTRYAKLRAEEILCRGKVFSGEATAVGMRSGYFIQLAHHYREAFNDKYLVTEIHHRGSQSGALLNGVKSPFNSADSGDTSYGNSFRAIPARQQFRAERSTPKPRVAGTMSATIDAEGSDQYAELDALGQYKVQLPFDQTDKAPGKGSARVRMATPYSGRDHGMHFPLHKNAEVLLSFTNGDPDQPVILGSLPNSENTNVVNSANAPTGHIISAGGNKISFHDEKGKEAIWLGSPNNASIRIGAVGDSDTGDIQIVSNKSKQVAFEASNNFFMGVKNSLNLSLDNTVSASLSHTTKLGYSTICSFGGSAGISFGPSFKLNEGPSSEFSETSNSTGSKSVSIKAGMYKRSKRHTDQVHDRVKLAGILAISAANAVNITLGSLTATDVFSDKSTIGAGELFGESMIPGILIHTLVVALSVYLATENKKDAEYTSKIDADGKGIVLKVAVEASGVAEPKTGRIILEAKHVLLGYEKSEAILNETELTLSFADKTSRIVLDQNQLSLSHSSEKSKMTLAPTQISLGCGQAKMILLLSGKTTIDGSLILLG